jgi:Glu-tRNA(Gln) amidotransferase subunit E-like FAD-binding protein
MIKENPEEKEKVINDILDRYNEKKIDKDQMKRMLREYAESKGIKIKLIASNGKMGLKKIE